LFAAPVLAIPGLCGQGVGLRAGREEAFLIAANLPFRFFFSVSAPSSPLSAFRLNDDRFYAGRAAT